MLDYWTIRALNVRNVNEFSLAQFQSISEAQRTLLVRNRCQYTFNFNK